MTSTVRDQTPAVETMAEDYPIVAALLGGTTAMRKAGSTYLPQWPNEDDDAYANRVKTATLFPAFGRTCEVLTGKPFSKPVTLGEDVPPRIVEWCDDIDLQGHNLHAFAAAVCFHVISYGMCGILVDFPNAGALRTKAEEVAAGVRPYFVHIHAQSILGWRAERINGVQTLTQFRFLEVVSEPDGEFGEKEVEQVRVLYPGRWQVWRESEKADASGKKDWVLYDEGETTLQKIPFVPVYGRRTGFMQAAPPLVELAHMNVEHWQSKSDQQTILHIARVPILFAKMLGDNPITVGAATAVKSDDPEGDLKFVEHTGQAIKAGSDELLALEDRMRQVGAELLVIKPGNMTVAHTVADNEAGMCTLQRIIQDLEDATDAALALAAEWVKEPEGGHIEIFNDFGVASLAEASLELLRDMNVDGTFSDESLFAEAQRRGVISPERKWEDEKLRIKQNAVKVTAAQVQIKDT
ncbi:DUF4055 domain-containing protein [Pararobbsia alpina]|uniref:DUF4055 domain-containing protein n=1 Tax=Pararobbsia alpina TaxID=621374 RepID=A0A6S7B188_9BURK|nr:DUF4055 domain-containing protein [Pararobbsia alpina]CAB3784372.1 hypothetical protein LMG28138_01796 [Pararobbsia alpina]